MPGLLVSMSTLIHFAIFAVTGFGRICQCSLFSQVSAVGVHLDNFVSHAMPGLLVCHVHHTFCNFHSDWVLQDLPTFFLSLVSTSNLRTLMSVSFHPSIRTSQGYLFSMSTIHFATFTVTGFCRICQISFCLWCLPQT